MLTAKPLHATKAVICAHSQNLANGASLDQVPDLNTQREIPCPHSLHEEQVLLPRRLNKDPCLLSIHCKCLLTENMLPCFQDKHDILKVVRVWGCNIDDINVGVSRESLVGAVRGAGRWNPGVRDKFLCARSGGRRRHCYDCVGDVGGRAGRGVEEEVADKGWTVG